MVNHLYSQLLFDKTISDIQCSGLHSPFRRKKSTVPFLLFSLQAALGILIPALQSELAGSRRRKLLHDEVSKWMRRAECVKETLAIQEKVLTDSVAMSADAPDAKTCKMQ